MYWLYERLIAILVRDIERERERERERETDRQTDKQRDREVWERDRGKLRQRDTKRERGESERNKEIEKRKSLKEKGETERQKRKGRGGDIFSEQIFLNWKSKSIIKLGQSFRTKIIMTFFYRKTQTARQNNWFCDCSFSERRFAALRAVRKIFQGFVIFIFQSATKLSI